MRILCHARRTDGRTDQRQGTAPTAAVVYLSEGKERPTASAAAADFVVYQEQSRERNRQSSLARSLGLAWLDVARAERSLSIYESMAALSASVLSPARYRQTRTDGWLIFSQQLQLPSRFAADERSDAQAELKP